jgi:hypothetical protein
MLDKFNGKTVIVGLDGGVNSARIINNFAWRIEPDINGGKYIMIYSLPTEEYLSISIDEIDNYEGYFNGENELIIHLKNKNIFQIYINE